MNLKLFLLAVLLDHSIGWPLVRPHNGPTNVLDILKIITWYSQLLPYDREYIDHLVHPMPKDVTSSSLRPHLRPTSSPDWYSKMNDTPPKYYQPDSRNDDNEDDLDDEMPNRRHNGPFTNIMTHITGVMSGLAGISQQQQQTQVVQVPVQQSPMMMDDAYARIREQELRLEQQRELQKIKGEMATQQQLDSMRARQQEAELNTLRNKAERTRMNQQQADWEFEKQKFHTDSAQEYQKLQNVQNSLITEKKVNVIQNQMGPPFVG